MGFQGLPRDRLSGIKVSVDELRAAGSPRILSSRLSLILVAKGRVSLGLGAAAGAAPSIGSGKIVALASVGRSEASVTARGHEDARLVWIGFDRDPTAWALRLLAHDGLDAEWRSPWQTETSIFDPGPGGARLFEGCSRLLSSALGELAIDPLAPAASFIASTCVAQFVAILYSASLAKSDVPASGTWTVEDVLAWIDGHYDESFTLGEMVRRCALNTTDFSRRFKDAAGFPLFEYLNRKRISRAALLLRDGDLPVTEIALGVGYNNLSFFNRYFHRIMGMSPGEYRRSRR